MHQVQTKTKTLKSSITRSKKAMKQLKSQDIRNVMGDLSSNIGSKRAENIIGPLISQYERKMKEETDSLHFARKKT